MRGLVLIKKTKSHYENKKYLGEREKIAVEKSHLTMENCTAIEKVGAPDL